MIEGAWLLGYRADDGLIELEHLDGVPWYDAPVPRRWHRCQPQTRGWHDLRRVYRCACGAISYDARHWDERNGR